MEPTKEESARAAEQRRLSDEAQLMRLLEPYWPHEFAMPASEEEWLEAFRLYIYGPQGDLKEWIGDDLDGYYESRLMEAEAVGYYEAFRNMVFAMEA